MSPNLLAREPVQPEVPDAVKKNTPAASRRGGAVILVTLEERRRTGWF